MNNALEIQTESKNLTDLNGHFGKKQIEILNAFSAIGFQLPVIPQKTWGLRHLRGDSFSRNRVKNLHSRIFAKLNSINFKDKTDALILAYFLIGQSNQETSDWLFSNQNGINSDQKVFNRFKRIEASGVGKRLEKILNSIKETNPYRNKLRGRKINQADLNVIAEIEKAILLSDDVGKIEKILAAGSIQNRKLYFIRLLKLANDLRNRPNCVKYLNDWILRAGGEIKRPYKTRSPSLRPLTIVENKKVLENQVNELEKPNPKIEVKNTTIIRRLG